jgi:hypothetical protein
MSTIKEDKQVVSTSDEAASIQTVTGWVSRLGRFWGNDERMARYEGSTHGVCGCGVVVEKSYIRCNSCRAVEERERYQARPFQVWDGVTPLYSDARDEYFMDAQTLVDMLADQEIAPAIEDLRLVICAPNYAGQIESDHWADDLPEDGDIPGEMAEAMKVFNEVISRQAPLSWSPGKYAADAESVRSNTSTEGDEA